jgi:hypothetical protein
MTTNRFYAAQTPRWLRELASDRPPSRFFREKWRPIDPAAVAALAGSADDQAGEMGNDGFDTRFPHSMAEVPSAAEAIVNTPYGTEILFDAAEAAVRGEAMGADAVPDLLAISVSSHDYAAHGWGMESWERADVLLRLDQRLGTFLEHLDEMVGADRYAVVLSSDHGGMRLIERQQAAGAEVFRIEKQQIRAAADRAAERVLGAGPWVRGVSGNVIHVMPSFADQAADRRDLAIHDMVNAVRAVPGIGFAAPTAELTGDCARQGDPMRRLACNSLAPGQLGPIIVLAADGSHISGEHAWGASHGGPSVDERTVPIIVVAPGRPHERRDQPVSMLSVAPTGGVACHRAADPSERRPGLPRGSSVVEGPPGSIVARAALRAGHAAIHAPPRRRKSRPPHSVQGRRGELTRAGGPPNCVRTESIIAGLRYAPRRRSSAALRSPLGPSRAARRRSARRRARPSSRASRRAHRVRVCRLISQSTKASMAAMIARPKAIWRQL